MDQTTERFRTIIEGLQQGDEAAFRELYDATSAKLFSYIVPRASDRDAALDMLQEVFVGVWSSRMRFSYVNDASVWGFLFTIARRTLAAHYSARSRDAAVAELPVDDRYDMDVSALGDVHTVERALGELGDDDRDVVTLRYWSELSFAEIAALRGKTETAVRVQHHRALAKLESIINRHEPTQ